MMLTRANGEPYRILLVNDDGINAPGLEVLESIAAELSDDVWIVAPEQEQSGQGVPFPCHIPCGCASLIGAVMPLKVHRLTVC